MMQVVQVSGLVETISALTVFEPALRRQVNKAGRESAKIVADAARARVPVRSGRLQSSIRAGADRRGAYVRAGNARVPYAAPIHFGWRARHIRPNPFLYDAADSRVEAVRATYEKQIIELIAALGL